MRSSYLGNDLIPALLRFKLLVETTHEVGRSVRFIAQVSEVVEQGRTCCRKSRQHEEEDEWTHVGVGRVS
jgi:hypothetical protein